MLSPLLNKTPCLSVGVVSHRLLWSSVVQEGAGEVSTQEDRWIDITHEASAHQCVCMDGWRGGCTLPGTLLTSRPGISVGKPLSNTLIVDELSLLFKIITLLMNNRNICLMYISLTIFSRTSPDVYTNNDDMLTIFFFFFTLP